MVTYAGSGNYLPDQELRHRYTERADLTTEVPGAATATSATLNASVNPEGTATTAEFIYGTDPTLQLGTTTRAPLPSEMIGSGIAAVAVTASITGLSPNTTYYWEAVASNAGGTTDGSIVGFSSGCTDTNTNAHADSNTNAHADSNSNAHADSNSNAHADTPAASSDQCRGEPLQEGNII